MRRVVVAAIVAGLVACTAPEAGPPARNKPPTQDMSGKKERATENCPSMVRGAVTKLALTDDGVDLTITAIDPGAQREIVARASRHDHVGQPIAGHPRHTGMHGGPGTIGYCPIVHDDTTISLTEVFGGVEIHVHANRHDRVRAVQLAVKQRVDALRH